VNRSESVKEIAAALALAQSEIKPAVKDAENPHLKSKYANLSSVWDAVREPLANNGLSVTQTFAPSEPGTITVVSTLLHKSGEWIESPLTLPVGQATAQGCGSAITYARRYGLSALLGVVADDDDDGHGASERPAQQRQPVRERQAVAQRPAPQPAEASEDWQKANKAVRAMLKKKGMDGIPDAARHKLAENVVGRPVASFTDMTAQELRAFYDWLKANYEDALAAAPLIDVPATGGRNHGDS
jgi:hypothetical protein